MGGSSAQLVFVDPPYNVQIRGHVSGKGRVRHREFAQASGEKTSASIYEIPGRYVWVFSPNTRSMVPFILFVPTGGTSTRC